MEKSELESALVAHGEQIKAKQVELSNVIDGQKAEVDAIKSATSKMQEQLDVVLTAQVKSANEGIQSEKSFIADLKGKLNDNIAKFSKYKSDSSFKEAIDIKVKSFLETDNASVTTGSLIPMPYLEAGVGKAPDRAPFLMNLIEVGGIASNVVTWVERKTRTDNTEWVGEGVAPGDETVLGYETISQNIKGFSSYIKVSNDSLDDVDYLLSEIRTELVTLMMLKIDHDILLGTVGANGYDGIKTIATQFAVPGGYVISPAGSATNKDVLRAAVAQVQIANFQPDYIILNPASVMVMDLEKSTTGEYLLAPFVSVDGTKIAGIPVVTNTGVGADEFIVGNFKKAKLFVRKDAELKVWEQNETDAVAQLKTITLYMRAALRIKSPDALAFVKGTFTAGKILLND